MTMDVGVLVKLGDKLTGPLRGVVSSVTASSKRMSDSFAKASYGMRQIGGGLGSMARQSRSVIGALAAYKGAMAGIALSFVRPAAQMERFRVQLTSLEGGSAGAEKALAWISDFATRTPLEMTDTIAAYAKLKAFGIDPTNGSLQSMVDTMAATGGGVEQLDGLVMALGQAWSKGKLQSEEALQLLERGVPVWDLLSKKMGKSSEEVQKLASEGKLGRDEISMLMAALGEKNAGAGDGMAKTWGGILSNLRDHFTRFQLMVMENGVFDSLKAKLQMFLDLLNQMAADGRLQRWADTLATHMLAAIEGIWNFGKVMLETWRAVFPWLEAGANAMGGWGNFLGLIAAGALAPKIVGIGKAFIEVGQGMTKLAKLAMRHPIIAAIALIAAGALLIYRNWGAISAWFSALWNGVTAAFQAAWGEIKSTLDRITPAPLKAAWSILTAYFAGLWRAVTTTFQGLIDFVAGVFTGDMTRAISGLRQIWDGFKIYIGAVFDAIASVLDLAWQTAIRPVLDGLASVTGIGAAWEGLKDALSSVLDWMGSAFERLWNKIGPVIEALRWVKDKGAAALAGLGLGGGEDTSSRPVQAKANGGRFTRGPVLTGENGPELRYENRDGYIAHNRALRQMARLSARSRTAGRSPVDPRLLGRTGAGKSITYAPSYAMTINAGAGGGQDVETAVRRALAAHHARAMVDLRREQND